MTRSRTALIAVALMLCASFATAFADDCAETGTVSRESYLSEISGRHRYYSLYLPPCYTKSTRFFPMLLLLHGSNADDSQWIRLGLADALEKAVASGDAPNMIVLMSFGDAIANENRFDGNTYDLILLDLLRQAEQRYRVNGQRAIGGISRGGFWAYHLGLRYREEFIAIGGHSPFFDRQHVAPAYNPLELAKALSAESGQHLWLDRGSRDHAAPGIEEMHETLQRRSINHQFKVYAGGEHSESSWTQNIADYVAFYGSAFSEGAIAQIEQESKGASLVELWLPAASFAALQTSVSRAELDELLAGQLNSRLAMSHSAYERLEQRGLVLHHNTRIVTDEQLERVLWRDKLSFTLVRFEELNLRLRPLWLDNTPIVDQLDDYPLAWANASGGFDAGRLTRITLSGSTALARQTRTAIDGLGIEHATDGIGDYVLRSDVFHMTNEASIAPTCPQFTESVLGGANSLCMADKHKGLFQQLEVDVIDLTGNHINDFGYDALLDTLGFLEAAGISTVGGGRNVRAARQPLIIEHNGNSIGWLACNAVGPYYALVNDDAQALGGVRPGAAYCDREWLQDAVPVLAAKVDLVLLTVQYQEYESYTPTAQQQSDYSAFAEMGADIVVGTAEHKPMTFEFYHTRRGETAFIHYGLGNLYFDQTFWGNMRFFMDTLYVYDGNLLAVELFPGIIEGQARPRLLDGEDQYNFLHFMMIQQNGF